jgi:hypothetical protein
MPVAIGRGQVPSAHSAPFPQAASLPTLGTSHHYMRLSRHCTLASSDGVGAAFEREGWHGRLGSARLSARSGGGPAGSRPTPGGTRLARLSRSFADSTIAALGSYQTSGSDAAEEQFLDRG